ASASTSNHREAPQIPPLAQGEEATTVGTLELSRDGTITVREAASGAGGVDAASLLQLSSSPGGSSSEGEGDDD
ncbi:unnamed protein product, partial [Heterosigma akashiwo]